MTIFVGIALDATPTELIRLDSISPIINDEQISHDNNKGDVSLVSSIACETLPQPNATNSCPTVFPWLKLEPSMCLEGASKAEVRTLAKFRADLDGLAPHSPGIAGGVRRSHHHHYLRWSLGGDLSSYRSLLTLCSYDRDDDTDFVINSDNDPPMRAWSSLPDLSMEECIRFTLPARSLSGDSDRFKNVSRDSILTCTSRSSFDQGFQGSVVNVSGIGGGPVIESNINFRLNQSRRLASVLLCCLERFWSNIDAKRNPCSGLPPLWLIFHLAGHPCVCFRQSVSSFCLNKCM